ncbi:hypothetical protein TPHA_0L01380 [Tetrapisispora phaffii CBS 4417]|uniref:Alkaline phosphatase n=1 Tax=Tetrapisispora phaffii (strain ATCC 24235 / CBS 4417 / NBRC 1672 / NRRL Y-8282 / UCD 70-5) TaxID=1071381 RepID=G8C015_TETPH|nr:hypothetical protein TPHA_0L01380 [Tetrapisispora phaffii CBS 4417]CCE65493.1 hypothetical protein TPHA_0L01380 [Tetrapisispora phaffii CBS 4417]
MIRSTNYDPISDPAYKAPRKVVSNKKKRSVLLTAVLTSVIMLLCMQLLVPGSLAFEHSRKTNKKNVIFFVTDGMGPTSLSLARSYRQFKYNLPYNDVLTLDKHLIGSSRTRSSDSLVTDSAAGATAFACALKTYNGAIGIYPDTQPCGTILESAKLNGYMTGLVVTTRITDATPASFSAHVNMRSQEDQIALQQLGHYVLGNMVDLMIGGGRTHFYSGEVESLNITNGARKDGRNLITESIENGWQYAGNKKEFDSLDGGKNVSLPLLCLLADDNIPFDVDRDENEFPSIKEQAMVAINALHEGTKDSEEGFFLMIEGSRIDHAGHNNDPAAQVREVLAFDEAFKAIIDYADSSDVDTIILSTSDHETGGLVAARQNEKDMIEYLWYPEILDNAKHSGEYLAQKISTFYKSNSLNSDKDDVNKSKSNFIKHEILEKELNIKDYTKEDIAELLSYGNDFMSIHYKLNDMVSMRAHVGWSTHGHSAVDVNIYAYSNNRQLWHDILDHLQGNHENIEIGTYMAKIMNLDLEKVTDLVKDVEHDPPKDFVSDLSAYVDQYHHKVI